MDYRTIPQDELAEWLRPFFEHIGLTPDHGIRLTVETEPGGCFVRYTLIDTDDPTADKPCSYRARAVLSGSAPEFTRALYEVTVPARSLAKVDADAHV